MDSPLVKIPEGQLQGCVKENIDGGKFYAFLGIPYAKPPVGNLRFKAPQPIDRWEGIRNATENGPKCIQSDPMSSAIEGSEDCLHLNIFTKDLSGDYSTLKPVIVYLHGGKFQMGSNSTDLYGPEFLLSEDIVLVVPNYRLGVLGFLTLEDTSLDIPGNAGLKDQNLALQWVKRNITNFGGDPNNVTLFGHSAGAMSSHYHFFSTSSKGLFHRAVLMSGSVFWTWSERCKFSLEKFANSLGITVGDEKEFLENLQKLPPQKIVEAQEDYLSSIGRSLVFGPVVEKPNNTAFLTKDPTDSLLNGEFAHLPILATYTSNEGLLFENIDRYIVESGRKICRCPPKPGDFVPNLMRAKMDDSSFREISLEIEKIYHNENSAMKRCLMLSDLHFIAPVTAAAKTHAELADAPVYLMRWSIEDELNLTKRNSKVCDLPGTCHGDELGYIFTNVDLPRPLPGSNADTAIRRFLHILKNFCVNGNPSPCQSDFKFEWLPLQKDKSFFVDFGNEVEIKPNPEHERMKFWQKILDFDKRNAILSTIKVE